MKSYRQRRAEMNNIYRECARRPGIRGWVAAAIATIGLSLILLLVIAVWMDSIPERTQLFMKGCVGLFAIISIICTAIYYYKSNSAYWKARNTEL